MDLTELISEKDLQKKVAELGLKISEDYAGEKLLVVGILKGSWIFMADLVRKLEIDIQCSFLKASSYGKEQISSGKMRLTGIVGSSLTGMAILLVEDIVDTGLTLKTIKERILKFKPKSIKICTLLDKPSRRKVELKPDYVGFTIPDKFVVGYGLDYAEQYRNLPYVGVLSSE